MQSRATPRTERTQGLSQQVVEAGDGFAEDGVDDAVFRVFRQEQGGGGDGEEEAEEAHASDGRVFQECEFVPPVGLRAEYVVDAQALQQDEREGEDGEEDEDFHSHELDERYGRQRADARRGGQKSVQQGGHDVSFAVWRFRLLR